MTYHVRTADPAAWLDPRTLRLARCPTWARAVALATKRAADAPQLIHDGRGHRLATVTTEGVALDHEGGLMI